MKLKALACFHFHFLTEQKKYSVSVVPGIKDIEEKGKAEFFSKSLSLFH